MTLTADQERQARESGERVVKELIDRNKERAERQNPLSGAHKPVVRQEQSS
jgi:hypothetical protein